jgi:hypothetical protein
MTGEFEFSFVANKINIRRVKKENESVDDLLS